MQKQKGGAMLSKLDIIKLEELLYHYLDELEEGLAAKLLNKDHEFESIDEDIILKLIFWKLCSDNKNVRNIMEILYDNNNFITSTKDFINGFKFAAEMFIGIFVEYTKDY